MTEIDEDYGNLKKVLRSYSKTFDAAWDELELDGKNLASENAKQPSLLARYNYLLAEIAAIVNEMDLRRRVVLAETLQFLDKQAKKAHSDSMLKQLAEENVKLRKATKAYNEAKEMYDKGEAIVRAFDKRGFSLTNLVKIYENEMQGITIYGQH